MELIFIYKSDNQIFLQSPEALPAVNVKVINVSNEVIYEEDFENIKFKCIILKQNEIANQVLLTNGARTYSKFFNITNNNKRKRIKTLSNVLITN